ncbi:MAG TPA: hypothetical protein VK698_03380 [Kofleriaceae bacterium]|nr:hypothetical protein [Kofleriaceae bacterium]
MKSERRKARLNRLMVAAAAISLSACAMEGDGDEEVGGAQNELTADESVTTQKGASVSNTEATAGAAASAESPADDDVVTPRVSCRRVTASSIPVFSTPSGSAVLCSFFQGDVFSHFGFVSPPGRYITWCPRGVPPSQGTTGYAQASGTVDGGCG